MGIKKKIYLLADELLSKWERCHRQTVCSFMLTKLPLHCVNAHLQWNCEFSIIIGSMILVVKSKQLSKWHNTGRFPQKKKKKKPI